VQGYPIPHFGSKRVPELLNLDCCAIFATIQIKQVQQPSYFQNAGRDSPASVDIFVANFEVHNKMISVNGGFVCGRKVYLHISIPFGKNS
jgi:hypothetical protein